MGTLSPELLPAEVSKVMPDLEQLYAYILENKDSVLGLELAAAKKLETYAPEIKKEIQDISGPLIISLRDEIAKGRSDFAIFGTKLAVGIFLGFIITGLINMFLSKPCIVHS